jgi:hypothetical protein
MAIFEKPGERAFRKCDVQEIKFEHLAFFDPTRKKLNRAKHVPVDKYPERLDAGYFAILECPRSQHENITSEYTAGYNKIEALKSLRRLAGELACQDCPFSGMTRAEAIQEQAKETNAEAALLEAQRLRTLALQELAAIDPAFQDPTLRDIE